MKSILTMSPTIDSSVYKLGDTTKFRISSARSKHPVNEGNESLSFSNGGENATKTRKSLKHRRTKVEIRDLETPIDETGNSAVGISSKEHAQSTLARDAAKSNSFIREPGFEAETKSLSVLNQLSLNHSSKNDAQNQEQRSFYSEGVKESIRNGHGVKKDMSQMISTTRPDSFTSNNVHSKVAEQFFRIEPCLYTHRMFVRAAKMFDFLKQDKDEERDMKNGGKKQVVEVVQSKDIPELDFKDSQEQIKTFELAFGTLKFQKLFSSILEQTGFFSEYVNLLDSYSTVCIILYDLQSRKFQTRKPFPDEELDQTCSEIEEALQSKKTRLQAHIARERIKHGASSIDYLLPEQVRHKDETKTKIPVYLWVNQMKITLEDILLELEADGFTRLSSSEAIFEYTGKVFQVDAHCSDLLCFPPEMDLFFKDAHWVRLGQLVQQDKSSCLAPQTVQHLLANDQDVIHVNVGSGMTTGHLASLLRHTCPQSHIWGYGVDTQEKAKKVARTLEFLGAKNTKILTEDFLNVDPDEAKLRSVKVILISANCSKSAITSPVQFMISEGEDLRLLGELSNAGLGSSNVTDYMLEHEKILRHALKFQRVQTVVYVTRSRYDEENELVVNRVMDYVNSSSNYRGPPFKVTSPVLPFSSEQIDSDQSGVQDRFIKFLPSDKSNGCFVAIISREPDDPKDVARSTIARARTKGLFGKSKSEILPENEDKPASSGLKRSKSGSRKLTSEVKPHVFKSKHSHKTPAAISARLYRTGLVQREQPAAQKNSRPEHLRVVKHPAPFR